MQHKLPYMSHIENDAPVTCLLPVVNKMIDNYNKVADNMEEATNAYRYNNSRTVEENCRKKLIYELSRILMVPEGASILDHARAIMKAMGKQYHFMPNENGNTLTVEFPKDHPVHSQIGHPELVQDAEDSGYYKW